MDTCNELALNLVNNYMNNLNMVGSSGMLWWVSSTVFVFSLIKAYVQYSKDIKNRYVLNAVQVFISFFILSIIGFGLFSARAVIRLEKNVISLVRYICPENMPMYSNFQDMSFFFLIGTTSFVFFFIVWVVILLMAAYTNSED